MKCCRLAWPHSAWIFSFRYRPLFYLKTGGAHRDGTGRARGSRKRPAEPASAEPILPAGTRPAVRPSCGREQPHEEWPHWTPTGHSERGPICRCCPAWQRHREAWPIRNGRAPSIKRHAVRRPAPGCRAECQDRHHTCGLSSCWNAYVDERRAAAIKECQQLHSAMTVLHGNSISEK
jgi:hypothetical protein